MMWRGLALLAATLAGFAGGYLVGVGNLESLQLRLQNVEQELRRIDSDPPRFRYFPPQEMEE